ncbi:MAG: hypothetical protein PVJ57_16090 [Phycisphaerae bacterium]
MNLDKMLSWRLLRVVAAPTPLEAGPYVPTPANMRTFLKTVERQGVAVPLVQALADAGSEFEQLVQAHAGNRATFDSMVSMLSAGEDAAKLHAQQKRAAFRANRHIFGVQAKTQLKCMVIQPSENPAYFDVASVGGFIDLRPLRRNARMVVSQSHVQNDDGSVRPVITRHPLDAEGQTDQGMALIRRFCSSPTPEIAAVEFAPGRMQCELVCDGIGDQAAMTCIEGHVFRGAIPRYREPGNVHADHRIRVRLPCEVLIFDMLMHRATYDNFQPISRVFSEHLTDLIGVADGDERDRLSLDESITCLGQGPAVLRAAEFPQYVELGEYIFDRLGWDRTQFDAYRCRIEYPIIPSVVEIRFELPEPPGGLGDEAAG